jgi:hypothetical protein
MIVAHREKGNGAADIMLLDDWELWAYAADNQAARSESPAAYRYAHRRAAERRGYGGRGDVEGDCRAG